ncbi:uncharacterized protein LOC126677179 [Mercurialis annua]|uniref:uncharacterized protein LOC126677179 n=1 Tax=Mercurialis annua TaxID=3986 RepID=UPI002160AAE9|nr:uncharacterized protein LOC126677179 [Mercurialis annua]
MVTSLSHLKRIEIRDCKLIKEIILTEETKKKTSKILFPKLDSLSLDGLPKLSRFCSGHPIEFQSLKELDIISCHALTSFVACVQQFYSEANNSSETQYLFNRMVEFPELEKLYLSKMNSLENTWDTQLMPNSFSNLKALTIHYCRKLSMVFPPGKLPRFRRLERLSISYCTVLQKIFQFQDLDAEDTYAAVKFNLRELEILLNGKLKMIWNKNFPIGFTFQELESVEVVDCGALKSIFPTSIATGLPRLQSLTVKSSPGGGVICGIEKIVAKSETAGSDPYFKFPQLKTLVLYGLLKLTCFYPDRHITEWPKLKSLELIQCDNAIIFGSEIINPNQEEAHGGGIQDNILQPLFMFEKVNRNLEELTLHHNDLMQILSSQPPANFFSKVKVLTLQSLRPESCSDLFGFLKTLYNLAKLLVKDGTLKELFAHEDAVYVKLRHLSIYELSYLKHIWNQDAISQSVTQCLETLTIGSCNSLSKIVQSAASFRSLVALNVNDCRTLKSLLTVSTAKTMVNLTEMSLRNCPTMTEVVENNRDQTEDEVVF